MSFSGAIYQCIDLQRLDGEEMLNVYFYSNAGTSSPGEFGELFISDVLTLVNDIQSVDLVHEVLVIRNILDTEADTVVVTGDLGAQALEALPHASAAAYTLRPATRTIRPGGKRYAGVPEAFTNHNIWNNVLYLPALEALRVQLSEVLVGEDSSYVPCIVKRIKYTAPSGNDAYRLPATGSEADISSVIAALLDINVSHQVSRGN